jgi:metal-dependent HD superfamily phosphatase/phosphodiesterase
MAYVFNLPARDNQKLKQVINAIKGDKKLQTYWRCSNVMAIERMGYTDHGPTHVKIVANLALKLLRALIAKGVQPSVVKDYNLKNEDAEVIVVLGAILHDLGMIVIRNRHEMYSTTLALEFLQRFLSPIYSEEETAILTSEVLHIIVSHEQPYVKNNNMLTVEAGIVGIADALDMEAGRARIPFKAGKIDIHAVSALSIQKVEILEPAQKDQPITIKITMTDTAGIFQIDELLKPRIQTSPIKEHFHVVAEIKTQNEQRFIDKFEI